MVVNVYVSAVTTDNVSRHELVAWVNTLLQSQFSKIEEMATGAAYAQLTHMIFPDQISLRKVKWNSKNDIDHLNNWKIISVAWKEIGIDKPLQVERLVKAKFQDNYEFLQWFYKFFNSNLNESVDEYDAMAYRGGEALPAGAKGPARPIAPRAAAAPRPAPTVRKAPVAASTTAPRAAAAATPASSATDKIQIAQLLAAAQELTEKNQELEALLAERDEALQTAEAERQFYFEKLRQVEDMCNALPDGTQPDKEAVLAVLYAADGETPAAEPQTNAPEEHQNGAAVDLDETETF